MRAQKSVDFCLDRTQLLSAVSLTRLVSADFSDCVEKNDLVAKIQAIMATKGRLTSRLSRVDNI